MAARTIRPPLVFTLLMGLSAGWGADCRAASLLYTVTDLGATDPAPYPSVFDSPALHPTLGLSLTDGEKAALPSVEVLAYATFTRLVSFQMTPYQNTDSGIVLGAVPSGGDLAMPYASLEYGYTRKQADGTFSPFVPLALKDGSYPYNGMASLDAKGNILLTNGFGQNLIDVNTGTTTDLTKLLPPGTLDHDGISSIIHHARMTADGTILADVVSTNGRYPDGSYEHILMLTPPLSTPEPSTLATFAVIVAGLGVARRRPRS